MSKNLLLIIRKLESSHDISIVDDLDSIICTGYDEKCLSCLKDKLSDQCRAKFFVKFQQNKSFPRETGKKIHVMILFR